MVLNYIWVAFFVIAFIVALIKLLFMGNTEIFTELVNSTFYFLENSLRNIAGPDGYPFTMARHYEDRRAKRL